MIELWLTKYFLSPLLSKHLGIKTYKKNKVYNQIIKAKRIGIKYAKNKT
jgi:hypothetical protein